MILTVITTINGLTKGIEKFLQYPKTKNMIVIGDKGSKNINEIRKGLQYYSFEQQLSFKELKSSMMPERHYSRKNIGYLLAIKKGANIIYETDDDNIPHSENFLDDLSKGFVIDIRSENNVVFNCYKLFTDQFIWPRGFPLSEINSDVEYNINKEKLIEASIVQGLADSDPDVDAIFRLSRKYMPINFSRKDHSFLLPTQCYCPFNSQNTLWKKEAFALLYLPVTVSFRFTDILRSFVAKRCLDHFNLYLAFANATVYQERNQHDLFKDFQDEIECYINTPAVIQCLIDTVFHQSDSLTDCLLKIYSNLVLAKLVKKDELLHLNNWITDFKFVSRSNEV
ncbi:MAG: STELLO glycosyltransferase family protein [Paraglaciecola sp.]|uniref:STELLO glycosyltransferase family protein n=1 Tax=Paraglaciecola sp. TaxID=1920173 RepID=UPI00273D2FF8|nr:STELLO glycosyltransferase family protein [Paraglaciecola sp.]MDP5030354.1 STELLO glycosyltransferase family protein [Paraglaciecola sp.]MDP5129244.1 STELLO glycosyltransferase family protein [Paraglaciecola sp.]